LHGAAIFDDQNVIHDSVPRCFDNQ